MINKKKFFQKDISEEEDKKSNSSVLNLSLESTKEISKESLSIENLSDIKQELMNEVNLPIENELEESEEFFLEKDESDSENNLYSKANLKDKKKVNNIEKEINKRKAIKAYVTKNNNLLKKPCHIKKEPNEYVSPLKLCTKTFGNIPKWNKKPNDILCDFQKNILDNKSCNDEDSQDDFFLLYSDEERPTPNHEDLKNLLNCRKKMILFKNTILDSNLKEYEDILNSDNIFMKKNNNKDMNGHLQKKSNFWHKLIRQQLKENNKNNNYLSRLSAGSIFNNNKKDKEEGLFILGILENAVNERKGRYTVNV